MQDDKLLSLIQVCSKSGVSYPGLFNLRMNNDFPKPHKTLNKRDVFFLESEIEE